ncbi:MAG TPA: hypothetical protein VM818_04885 [Vicinamibacterales bacterium]|nr:hypothetical protein [Vicinamibacterales bacterium]
MYCIIIKRGDYQRFDLLHRTFGSTTPVIWDRRVRERRGTSDTALMPERRQTQRRGQEPASWAALGFVVVQQPGHVAGRNVRMSW